MNTHIRHILVRISSVIRRGNHFSAAHLAKCAANYAQLTPLSPYQRTVTLFPNQPAYEYNGRFVSWASMSKRVSRFASALQRFGIRRGDAVSIMAPNVPAIFEAHFAVPGIGAVLHSINTRLDATTIAYQLNHSEAKIVFVDSEYNQLMIEACDLMARNGSKLPLFINISDSTANFAATTAPLIGATEYEKFLDSGDEGFELLPCQDEWDAISLNYTSGTTGNPKGVVCTHRGAYLNSVSNALEWNMERFAKLLWSKASNLYLLLQC
jgi:fatty-acyl-CoA synthase